jgi:epoxide hydrolase-like predicted phosphatase
MTIEAIIFDIGGVLVRTPDWSHRARWEHRLGLPERGLSALVFETEQATLASIGRAPDDEIWRNIATHLHLQDQQLAELRHDFWAGDVANTELITYMRALRPRHKTGILSNAWPEMRLLNENRFGLDDAVDQTLYSFEIGVLKPAPEAYEMIVGRLAVLPRNAVFIDDSAINIAGASAFGLNTVLFSDTKQAVAELNCLLADI